MKDEYSLEEGSVQMSLDQFLIGLKCKLGIRRCKAVCFTTFKMEISKWKKKNIQHKYLIKIINAIYTIHRIKM